MSGSLSHEVQSCWSSKAKNSGLGASVAAVRRQRQGESRPHVVLPDVACKMAARDESNIFDFYSNLVHQEPEDAGPFGMDGFAEWSSFEKFCKSLAHSVFQNMGPKGKEELLDKINSCATHQQIIAVIEKEPVISITVEMLLQEANDRAIDIKDASSAKKLREEGNCLFKKKEYPKSLHLYSRAIVLAPDDDVEFVLALANRSAAFFHLGQFQDSLADIDLVLDKGTYPEDRLYIVYGRKIQCLRYLKREAEASAVAEKAISALGSVITDESMLQMNADMIRSSLQRDIPSIKTEAQAPPRRQVLTKLLEANPRVPCLSRHLTVEYDPRLGRHLKAVTDVAAGTVLLEEEPFAFWVKPSAYEDFCQHCLKHIQNKHFIPCTSCSVRFCCKSCFDEGMDRYHWLECKFMDVLSIVSSGHLALRIIMREGLEKSLEMLVDKGGERYGVEQQHLNSDYRLLCSLTDHMADRLAEDKAAFAVACLFTAKLVNQELNFDITPLAALVLKHVLQIGCNVIGIDFDDSDPEAGGCQTLSQNCSVVAIGIFPTASLCNHSCDKRTYRIFRGKRLCLKAYDDLRCGQEVTFNYGPFDRRMSTKDRRDVLRRNFFFDCECSSCQGRQENVGSAFACPACLDGAVVVNYCDRTNYCVKCLRANVVDVDAMEEKMEQLRPSLELLWDELEQGNAADAEFGLSTMIRNYSRHLYDGSYRMIELKEKLAYVCELQNKLRESMKLWLQCFYSTRALEGEDNYDCLFFLLKITQALVAETDALLPLRPDAPVADTERARANVDKMHKYLRRALFVTKKLGGKEARLLEARDDVLHNLPDLHLLSRDVRRLHDLCTAAHESH